MSPGPIENARKGRLHTCCHTVSFGVVEFFSPLPSPPRSSPLAALFSCFFLLGMGGGGVEGDRGRITPGNRRGLSGDGARSCLLSRVVKGDWGWQLCPPGAKLPSLRWGCGPGVSHCVCASSSLMLHLNDLAQKQAGGGLWNCGPWKERAGRGRNASWRACCSAGILFTVALQKWTSTE